MKSFFGQFSAYKHVIAVAWLGLYAAFEASPDMQSYITATAVGLYHSLPHWAAAFIAGVVLPLFTFYHSGIKKALSDAAKSASNGAAAMFLIGAMLLGSAVPMAAQTTTTPPATTATNTSNSLGGLSNFYAAGFNFNTGVTPYFQGSLLYAKPLTATTAAFTVVDFVPATLKPFTVSTSVGAGVAQKVASIANHDILGTASLGVAYDSQNTGYAFTFGGGVPFKLKTSNWYIMPTLRAYKSNVGGQGVLPVFGAYIGWGTPAPAQ